MKLYLTLPYFTTEHCYKPQKSGSWNCSQSTYHYWSVKSFRDMEYLKPHHDMYSLSVTNCKPSQSDNTVAAVTSTVVVVLIIAVTVIVIVVLLLRNRKGHYSPGMQRLYVNFCNSTYISPVQRSNKFI